MLKLDDLKSAIRDVPDFPKKGIIFKDITTLLNKPDYFRQAVDNTINYFAKDKLDYIAGNLVQLLVLKSARIYILPRLSV